MQGVNVQKVVWLHLTIFNSSDNDFKLRVEEIHDKKDLEKYKLVMDKFLKNFNDDDRFALEMSEIDDLDIDLNDTVDEPVDMAEGN